MVLHVGLGNGHKRLWSGTTKGVVTTTKVNSTYGEKLPHTEHHFLVEAVLEGPTAAVRYDGTSGGS